jgi:hypothetical protein
MAKLDIGPETPRTYDLAKSADRGIQKPSDLLRKAMRLAQELEKEVDQLRAKRDLLRLGRDLR